MGKVALIATHEFVEHLRRRSFIVTTLLVPLMSLLIAFGVSLAGGDSRQNDQLISFLLLQGEPAVIGVVDQSGLIDQVPEDPGDVQFRLYHDAAAARAALIAGAIDAYYVVPDNYLSTGAVTRYAFEIAVAVDGDAFERLLRLNLLDGDARRVRLLQEVPALPTVRLDARGGDVAVDERSETDIEWNPLAFVAPYAFALLLYTTILVSAGYLLHSVTDEKENRTIEILLVSIRPWELLSGKVVGLGLLGLLQMLIWLLPSRALLGLTTGSPGLFDQMLVLPWHVWMLGFVYFLLGYMFYGAIFAGIGATTTNVRESGPITTLMMIPFMAPLWFLVPIAQEPNGTISAVLSVIPLTAPVTMMIRVILADVALPQVLLSIALLGVAAALAIWLAARLFRVSTLLAGKRLSLVEVTRALRAG